MAISLAPCWPAAGGSEHSRGGPTQLPACVPKEWRSTEGDLIDARAVERAVAGCSHVFHIAALYREAKHPDQVYRDVNVGGTRNIVEAADRHAVGRVIHCSTAGVHGDIAALPADEVAPYNPGDIYQETKLEGELLARRAFAEGLPGVVFRPVGIYGPGDLRFLKLFRSIQNKRFVMFGQRRC